MAAPCLFSRLKALTSSGVKSWVVTPNKPRLTSPCLTSDSLMVIIILVGMAKPMPTLPPLGARIAVFMPINSPRRLTRAPPELPGLIDASVWIKFSNFSMPRPERPKALTMPEVTVWLSPNGLPIATTKSPTFSWLESAMGNWVKLLPGTRMIAISDAGSVPINSALSWRPSCKVTMILSALSMT